MLEDVRNHNHLRVYECKVCHKMNGNSYICAECKRTFAGLQSKQAKKKQKSIQKRCCVNCSRLILNKGRAALRCDNCHAMTTRLRNSLRLQIRYNDRQVAKLLEEKKRPVTNRKRIENLQEYRAKLVSRFRATYVITANKPKSSDIK